MLKIILIILGVVTSWWQPVGVMAGETKREVGFNLSPSFNEIVLNKDESEKSFILKITNNTELSENFRLSVMDFGSLEESAGAAFIATKKSELENKYALASWVSLEKDAVVVDPGKTIPVKVSILNKESLSPGGHYAAVLINLENRPEGAKEIVGVNQSYASLIFVKKTGGEIYKMDLKNIEVDGNWLNVNKTVKMRFQNGGNVHVVPRGTVEVKDWLNRVVAKGAINVDSLIIMPENFRNYSTTVNPAALALVPGIYNVTLNYRYDGAETFLVKRLKFFYLGWSAVAAVSIVLLVALAKAASRKRAQK